MKILMTALLLLSLLTAPAAALSEDSRLHIVALNFPAYDFSRQIAGDRAQVTLLLPPGMDAHSFEPSPRDLILVQGADLLVYNGGIGDHWVEGLLSAMGQDAPPALAMMGLVDTVSEELVTGMEDAEHAHEDPAGEEAEHGGDADSHGETPEARDLDEHVWTSPRNAILIALGIADALSGLDPEGADTYERNFLAYEAQLKQLDADFRALVDGAPRRVIVLGDRFPMRYFTMEYGLDYYAAFPGCSAQTEPSARTIAFLMDKVREEKLPVVFYIELSNQKSARLIAAETGATPLLLHSAHNVSQEEFERGVTYLSLMRDNLNMLREALY